MQIRTLRCFLLFLLVLDSSTFLFSQKQVPLSDPQAIALATQAIAALTNGTTISDVTLTGNATWIAGSASDNGSVTLMAKGTGQSRMDLKLSGGSRSEIRATTGSGVGLGQWMDAKGSFHDFAFHNCLTDAAWFFPALSSLAQGPNVVLSYVGQENRHGVSVQHIHSYVYSSSPLNEQLSAMDFYLESNSLLLVAITFNVHPDNDQATNIPVEIYFSSYQTMNGVVAPAHIQKFLDRQLILDMAISAATINSGLANSEFQLN
jgi:hypothetical protein